MTIKKRAKGKITKVESQDFEEEFKRHKKEKNEALEDLRRMEEDLGDDFDMAVE